LLRPLVTEDSRQLIAPAMLVRVIHESQKPNQIH